MGLLSFVFGRRAKDNAAAAAAARGSPSTKGEQKTRTSTQPAANTATAELPRKPSPAHVTRRHTKTPSQGSILPTPTTATHDPKPDDGPSRRKSRRFSLGRAKAGELMKRRRSIFGHQASSKAGEETPQTPAVPAMWQGRDRRVKPSMDEDVRPGTAITVDEPVSATTLAEDQAATDRISKRLTLLENPTRKSSNAGKSTTLERKRSNRRSLFGGVADDDEDDDGDAPVLPAVPVRLVEHKSAHASDVAEKRKSRTTPSTRTRGKSESRRSQRWSLFQSSNPDYNDAVPSLPVTSPAEQSTRLRAAKPSHTPSISYYSIHPDTAAASTTHPAREAYRPRSSAKGFLNTTTGGTENARRSFRQSLYDDGDEDVSFLSPEQQREWDKMRLLMEAIDARDDATTGEKADNAPDARGPKSDAERFSNAQALAALEFGVAI